MKAVTLPNPGGYQLLRLSDVPDPSPGPEELLVQVRACALNRADLLQCQGLYPAPPGFPQDIPGMEYSGEVLAAGPRARRFKVGDRVMGLVGGGAFAERLAVHDREALPVPGDMTWREAAALPEAFLTAYDALCLQGGLRAQETVLVHAVASGVGTAAAQLASALGARVVGTARSEQKLERCRELGVTHPVHCPTSPPRFKEEVLALTGGKGADLALDLLGGDYLVETLPSMATGGRVMLVGLLAGREANLPLGTLLSRRLRLTGTVLRSRPLEQKISLAQSFQEYGLPFFEQGKLRAVVDSAYPMAEVVAACARMSGNQTFGKVVLEWKA